MRKKIETEKNESSWSQSEVQKISERLNLEMDALEPDEDWKALLYRYFGPEGIIEKTLNELQGADMDFDDMMDIAYELYSLKSGALSSPFLVHFSEGIIQEYFDKIDTVSCDDFAPEPSVNEIKQAFDNESSEDVIDLDGLRNKYLSSSGLINQAFQRLSSPGKKQLAIGMNLFELIAYIETMLFGAKALSRQERWTVPEVRKIDCQFEWDVITADPDEDCRVLYDRYLGKDGIIETQLRQLDGTNDGMKLQHVEELCCLRDDMKEMFSSVC